MNQAAAAEARHAAFVTNRGAIVSAAVGGLCFLGFMLAADQLTSAGWLLPQMEALWQPHAVGAQAASQLLPELLLVMLRLIPGTGPATLLLVTVVTSSIGMAILHWRMRGRGWSLLGATLAVVAVAANPVTLILATSGSTLLITAALVWMVAVSFDRAARVGDAQSLISIGLALAGLVLTTPAALYICVPLLVVLPVGLREARDLPSAIALFLLTIFPALVAIAGIAVAASTLGEPASAALQRWVAPMHGVEALVNTPWHAAVGGQLSDSFFQLLLWCLMAVPLGIMPFVHALIGRGQEESLAVAFLVLFTAPLAGALATAQWHMQEPIWAMAVALAFAMAWLGARVLAGWERLLVLAVLVGGAFMAWQPDWMWGEQLTSQWWSALSGYPLPPPPSGAELLPVTTANPPYTPRLPR
jgi:hypothetical protein